MFHSFSSDPFVKLLAKAFPNTGSRGCHWLPSVCLLSCDLLFIAPFLRGSVFFIVFFIYKGETDYVWSFFLFAVRDPAGASHTGEEEVCVLTPNPTLLQILSGGRCSAS